MVLKIFFQARAHPQDDFSATRPPSDGIVLANQCNITGRDAAQALALPAP
jgi:hypothetical protein